MDQIHEVIIIGAGISGIGAARTLSAQGCPHAILESRDRVGGRIVSEKLWGIDVDIGATFIHNPGKNNMIYKFI